MKNWDRVLAFMLEKALKQLPAGTRIVVKQYELQQWLNSPRGKSAISLQIDTAEGGFDSIYAATLKDDPRATRTKRKFDLSMEE